MGRGLSLTSTSISELREDVQCVAVLFLQKVIDTAEHTEFDETQTCKPLAMLCECPIYNNVIDVQCINYRKVIYSFCAYTPRLKIPQATSLVPDGNHTLYSFHHSLSLPLSYFSTFHLTRDVVPTLFSVHLVISSHLIGIDNVMSLLSNYFNVRKDILCSLYSLDWTVFCQIHNT